jgi:hypothetical protein
MDKFENDFASIYFDKTLDAIILKFKKQAPSNDFINVNQKLLEIFKALKTNKFLVDARQIGVVSVEGQKWVVDNLFPGMLGHLKGKKLYHVQIVPKEVFGKVATNNIRSKASNTQPDEKMIIEAFESEDDAKNWLKSK